MFAKKSGPTFLECLLKRVAPLFGDAVNQNLNLELEHVLELMAV